nr:unnamed protein product [Callosobruchus analis]
MFHSRCAKYNNAKIIDENSLLCCDNAGSDGEIAFFDAAEEITGDEHKKIDISIFNYVIKQKDALIGELHERIKVLNSHIDLLNKFQEVKNTVPPTTDEQKTRESRSSKDKKQKNTNTHQLESAVNENNENNTSKQKYSTKVAVKDVSAAVMQACTETSLNRYININSDIGDASVRPSSGPSETGEWKKVQPRKRNRRTYLVGKNDGSGIKTTPKYVYLHVYRVDPNTSVDDMVCLLKDNFPEVLCEKLNSKYPKEYASFKVGVYECNFKPAMNPDVWPAGAYFNRFLEIRRKSNQIP